MSGMTVVIPDTYMDITAMKHTLLIGLAISLLAACGNGENNDNAATNNVSANNMSANNTSTSNNMSMSNNMSTTNNTSTTNNMSTNSGTVPCGAVTFEGECSDAATVTYCDDQFGLVEVDCAANAGANSTCVDITDWGADCAVPAGDECLAYDADADDYYFVYCTGVDAGCVWSSADAVTCTEDFAIACDADTFAESCVGDAYIYDCNIDQPLAADCAALGGGTCDAAMGCVMPAGAMCDDSILFCATGMTCTIPDGEAIGTCG